MQVLTRAIQEFINKNLNSEASDLILKSSLYPEWDMKAIVQQLVGKQIAKKKLPTWFDNNEVLYPVRLSMEQCSSELTANYKTRIINSGRGIDLTGGFGVDSIFLNPSFIVRKMKILHYWLTITLNHLSKIIVRFVLEMVLNI